MANATMTGSPSRPAADPKGFFKIGWGAIIILFGGLLAWSVLAPFEGAVLASGSVSVESNQQAIQHLEGGIVSKINVDEGDRVEEGQTLIVLDSTSTQARLASLEARLFELIGRETRLLAERENKKEMSLLSKYEVFADTPSLQSVLAAQRELLSARATSRATQVSLLRQTILQLERRASGLENEIIANERQSALIQEEVVALEVLLERGLSPRPRVLALKRDRARLDGEREALVAEVATTRIRVGEAQIEINQLTEGFREDVLTELREVQTQIAELSEQRVSAVDQSKRVDIVAPRAGRVLGVTTHTVGGVIPAGTPVMFIVPENDVLVASVRIAPTDIDKVEAGDEATLRFSAFNANTTPEVKGVVAKVSADALQDETTGAFFYEAIIEIPQDRVDDKEFQLLPGMPVDAQVKTESRTVISYLLKPLADAMSTTFRE